MSRRRRSSPGCGSGTDVTARIARFGTLLLVVASGACSGEAGGAGSADADTAAALAGAHVLDVRLTSEGIVPDSLRMAAGDTVRLSVVNATDRALEFMIGRDPTASAFMTPFFAGVEMLRMEGPILATETPTGAGRPARPGGEMRHQQVLFYLRPGERGAVTFTVPADRAGVWQMACFLEGHAQEGFSGVVMVAPSDSDPRAVGDP